MTEGSNQCWAYKISTLRNCMNSTGIGIQLSDGCLACAKSWLDLMPSTTEKKTKQNKTKLETQSYKLFYHVSSRLFLKEWLTLSFSGYLQKCKRMPHYQE